MASIATASSIEPTSINAHGVIAVAEQCMPKPRPSKWKRDLVFIVGQVRTLTLLLKHPLVPWPAKAAAGCAVAYLVSPIQLIPTFIPVIGQLDDLLVLFLGMKAVRKLTPAWLLKECEAQAISTSVFTRVEAEPSLIS